MLFVIDEPLKDNQTTAAQYDDQVQHTKGDIDDDMAMYGHHISRETTPASQRNNNGAMRAEES